jgi:hypothetical protein
MMLKRFLLPVFLFATLGLFGYSQESHLTESGTAPIMARSAFAHGYRHGYEEGYHLGNIDANMGRHPQLKKLDTGHMAYSPSFGSRPSFQEGFRAGLQAGYHDGYAGNDFRAVESARTLAARMEEANPAAGSSDDFDHGVGSGYRDGFVQGESSPSAPSTLDFVHISCTSSRPGTFCEGYRRGFVLGRVDALTLRRENILEASK